MQTNVSAAQEPESSLTMSPRNTTRPIVLLILRFQLRIFCVTECTVLFSFGASRTRLWSSGSRTAQGRHSSAPKSDHLSTRVEHFGHCLGSFSGPIRFPQHLFQCRRSRAVAPGIVSAKTAEVLPYVGLTVHFAVSTREYDRPVIQSMATPKPGCPDPHL